MRAAFAFLLLSGLALPGAAADSGAEITLRVDDRAAAVQGPLAQAEALQPGLAPATPSGRLLQAELRHLQRLPAGLSLQAHALLAHERLNGRGGSDRSRVNQLNAALDLGPWQLSAGKKVLGWDVGYGFRPNDVVQQETRRTLFGQTPEGRPLLLVEGFSAESTLALVWVNPQRWHRGLDQTRGALESALAARAYTRLGGLDLHGFARHGRHSGASAGLALSWVAGDEIELHASARAFERHDGWAGGPAASPLQSVNPWQQQSLGGGSQWLLGGQWTGGPRLSLLFEAWHDGNALSDAQWRDWGAHNRALAALAQHSGWRAAAAGNLAWQATPFNGDSLRRDNLFARLAWQPEDWTLSVDALLTPADRGRIVSAALQWKGQHWRLDAGLRFHGGPAASLIAQLPTRRSALLAATRVF